MVVSRSCLDHESTEALQTALSEEDCRDVRALFEQVLE